MKSARPPFVVLRVTDPLMRHPSVAWLQGLLNESKYVWPKLLEDGEFGPHTAQETEEALYRLGAPSPIAAIGPDNLSVLWDWSVDGALPLAWRARRIERMGLGFKKGWGITLRSWAGLHPGEAPEPETLVIHSRESLGLVPPRRESAVDQAATLGGVVHWQGPGRGAVGYEAAAAQLRGFQRYHMNTHGWNDIGYHFAIPKGMPVGTVFEGRGFGVYGAHSGHPTANARLGILVMFGEMDREPTADQLATLRMFLRAHARGVLTGHQEWSSTSCPGTALFSWVKANRQP